MSVKVRLFGKRDNRQRLNEDANAQQIATQISTLQNQKLDIEKRHTLQIQQLEKVKMQKINILNKKIIDLQAQLSAVSGIVNDTQNPNSTTAQQQNVDAGTAADK